MALTTSQLRLAWAPHCTGPWATLSLYGYGKVTVRPAIIEAVKALNKCLEASRYKTRAADTGAYNCRKITGGTDWSLHAYGIALDINWQSNPYGPTLITNMPRTMREAIKAIRTNNGKQVWRWGGDYTGNKDAMHYEVVCTPADLKTGINWNTVRGYVAPTPPPQEEEEEMSQIVWYKAQDGSKHAYHISGIHATHIGPGGRNLLKFLGVKEVTTVLDATWQDTMIIVDGPCKNQV